MEERIDTCESKMNSVTLDIGATKFRVEVGITKVKDIIKSTIKDT